MPSATIDSRYLYRVLETARDELQSLGQGTTFLELSRAKLRNFQLPIPDCREQTAIARFLDDATGQIGHYIRAKEKLIALLEEQKQVIIHNAVTGRIDVCTGKPYPTYKPSGIEWLKEVPSHWNSQVIKNLARPGYKTFVDGDWIESPFITWDGIRLIQTGNIGIGNYREKGFRYISPNFAWAWRAGHP